MSKFIRTTDGEFISIDHIALLRRDPQMRADAYMVWLADGSRGGYIDDATARNIVQQPRIVQIAAASETCLWALRSDGSVVRL